ncbi:MAG TPA: hypothetical protein VFB95_07120 [Candidatus Cryosericum sp.]|nr:hypothetical protein [Candidatus Cryosericum sp.]
MDVYTTFLGGMSVLFVGSAAALFCLSLVQFARRHGRRAAAYLALTVLASVVAAGFYFFRKLM